MLQASVFGSAAATSVANAAAAGALNGGGVDGALTAANAGLTVVSAIATHGGNAIDIRNAGDQFAFIAQHAGSVGAQSAAEAITNAIASGANGGEAANEIKAISAAITKAYNEGMTSQADLGTLTKTLPALFESKTLITQDVGEAVGETAALLWRATGSPVTIDKLDAAAHDIFNSYVAGGPKGLKLTGDTVKWVADHGGNPTMILKTANIISEDLQCFQQMALGENLPAAAAQADAANAVTVAVNKSSSNDVYTFFYKLQRNSGLIDPPQQLNVLTTNDPPTPLDPLKSKLNDSQLALTHDLQTGADKATIEKDAQQVAALAGQLNNPVLQQVALLVGSGFYKDSSQALQFLQQANQSGGPFYAPVPLLTDPMPQGGHTPLNDAYLQLEVDISSNADKQKIKSDAQTVEQLAGQNNPELANAAHNISASIDDGSYDQTGSLTALMNNPSNAGAPPQSPPSSPPSDPPSGSPPGKTISAPDAPPDEIAAYQKLLDDLTKGAFGTTIEADAVRLAGLATQNGDDHLAQVALDIGDVTLGTNLDIPAMDGIKGLGPAALNDLNSATPGTRAAQGDA